MATEKQQALLKLLSENSRAQGKRKTLGQMLLEAGYAESVSVQPDRAMNTKAVKEGVKSIVEEMELARKQAIARMKETVGDAEYRDVAGAVDKLTKNIQLLTGGETERIGGLKDLFDRAKQDADNE